MARKIRSKSSNKRPARRFGSAASFLIFLAFFLTVLYLWGSVQIDFVLRENDRLETSRRELDRVVNDLRIQVNGLKSYQRIVRLAHEQGLVILPASRLTEISVDLRGASEAAEEESWGIQMAGFGIGDVIPSGKNR